MPPADDLDRIMAVMAAAFDPAYGEAWSRRQVEDSLLLGYTHYLLIGAEGHMPPLGDEAAGFALSRTGFDEEELLLFAVVPAQRGQGLGRTMLARLAADARARGARRLLLEMRAGNPAQRLYSAFGFKQIGQRPKYYRLASGGMADAITFACDLL